MKSVIFIAISCIFLFSCEKENSVKLSGTYKGHFYRSSPIGLWESSDVTLHFNENSFSGQSSDARYPAICHGSFEVIGSDITFNNNCTWTADFDWTLILNGKFQYEINGDNLKLWKKKGDITDTYELHKQ